MVLKKTILIVDDDTADRMIYSRWLKDNNYQLKEAHDVDEAMLICKETPVDCIILDYLMGGKDGFQMLTAYRRMYSKETPIILISAYDSKEMEEDAYELGANDFLAKESIDHDVLNNAVGKLLTAAAA